MKRLFGAFTLAALGLFGPLTAQDAKQPPAKAEDKKAEVKKSKITVLVPPDSTTDVRFEGQATRSSGDKREFVTPELDPTKTYKYKIEAKIEPNNYTTITRTRDVEFKGGVDVVVDMTAKAEKDAEDVKIRWVPTPDDIVEEMGKLGGLKKDDVVMDLGCGDAIMLITAVKKFGVKKAIGVDIDPAMVKRAKEEVEKAGLKDVIEIREGDILKLGSIADANVVMVYLGDYMMDRLQPTFETLKPGSKIVSHRFVMSKWKADKSITVTGKDGDEYNLHVWEVKEKK